MPDAPPIAGPSDPSCARSGRMALLARGFALALALALAVVLALVAALVLALVLGAILPAEAAEAAEGAPVPPTSQATREFAHLTPAPGSAQTRARADGQPACP